VQLAIDLYEDFIDVGCVAVTLMLPLQSAGISGSEFDAPESDGLAADGYATLGKKIFDIAVAQIESKVEPDSIGNNVRWESVALVCIHLPILAVLASLLVSTAALR